MIISQYGINLRSLTRSDLEMVRTWRNSDHVRLKMNYRSIISQEAQIKWFTGLNQESNIYFIIETNGVPVGLCNMKNIDWKLGLGEGGIFIGAQDRLNSTIPVRAILTASEYFCDLLYINRVNISIVKGNDVSVRFNRMLGAEECGNENGMLRMFFTREMLHERSDALRAGIAKRYGEQQSTIKLTPESTAELELLSRRIELNKSRVLKPLRKEKLLWSYTCQ